MILKVLFLKQKWFYFPEVPGENLFAGGCASGDWRILSKITAHYLQIQNKVPV